MALVDCTECGRWVSSAASACPKCGHSIHPATMDATDPTESHSIDTGTREGAVLDSPEPPEGGQRSGFPTWLLFVIVFVGGSVVLVAGSFAAVIVFGAIIDEVEDSITTSDTTTAATTVTTVLAGGENGLSVGDCIDDDELDRYLTGDDFSTMSCDEPHDYETYYAHEFAAGPYPGDQTVIDDLHDLCQGRFEVFVGRDYETSALDIFALWPGQSLWEAGFRNGECLLFHVDSNKLTGSAYQSGW